MQAASHGARRIRHAPTLIPGPGPGNAARSIHIPAFARPSSAGTAKRIASQARTILTRFAGHLTTPGLSAPYATFQQALRGSAPGRMSSIQERLSFSARHALARNPQQQFLPRAPISISRSVTQVGLGTARNFSSGRSVFQNLVENVPIAGRTLYEADLDVRMQFSRDEFKKKSFKAKGAMVEQKEMLKARNVIASIPVPILAPESVSEMDHYFAAPATPPVTTSLYIPLAPTPSNRVPLPPDVSDHPSLLPLPTLASVHNSHEMHSLRVSALFSRLDVANVWEKGALCSAYSERAHEGVCTILKVEFVGWTEVEVRSVIGESGTGWCALEEVTTDEFEEVASDASSVSEDISGSPFVEPADSLVLPTLDLSSVFVADSTLPLQHPSSDHDMFFEVESDPWADSSSDGSWADYNYLAFSSDFTSKLQTHDQWLSSSNEVSA